MKFWIAMAGDDTSKWNNWLDSIKNWLEHTCEYTIAKSEVNGAYFAEIIYTHIKPNFSIDSPWVASLPASMVLEGCLTAPWVKKRLDSLELGEEDRVLAHSYLSSNPHQSLKEATGDFTLAFWDNHLQTFYAATDIYGTRPLYYWRDPQGCLYTANDLRLLLLIEHIPFLIDEKLCCAYPTSSFSIGENSYEDERKTFFKGIFKLEAASLLVYKQRELVISNYWTLEGNQPFSLLNEDATPAFREVLLQAVSSRLSEKKTIIELSGGLDSANILGAAIASGAQDSLFAVNLSFEAQDMAYSHDYSLVKKLLTDLRIPGAIILGDTTTRIPNIEQGRDPIRFLDGPDPQANPFAIESFAAVALEIGVERTLTGDGGDYVASGEKAVIDSMLYQHKWRPAFSAIKNWSEGQWLAACKIAYQYGVCPFIPFLKEKMYYNLLWSDIDFKLPPYFTPYLQQLEHSQQKKEIVRFKKSRFLPLWGQRYHFDMLYPRARYLDTSVCIQQHMHPFYDRKLLELVLRIPTEQHFDLSKIKESSYKASKQLLRKCFADILPPYLLQRETKTTYAHMARKFLTSEKKNLLAMVAGKNTLNVCELGIIDKEKFREELIATLIRSEDINNDLGMSYQYLRSVINLEIWLREMGQGRDKVLERAKPIAPRQYAKVEVFSP